MTVCRTIGGGERRVVLAAVRPAEAWQLWLASQLARAGLRVDLVESNPSGAAGDWQRRETARAAAKLDQWFDKPSLEAMFREQELPEGPCDLYVRCGAEEEFRSVQSETKLGAVTVELFAHPRLTRMFAIVEAASRAVIRPQVAPGDDFDSVWLRLLVETSRRTVEAVQALVDGAGPAAAGPRLQLEAADWTDYAAYRLNGRGLRARDTLETGFLA